MLSNREAVHSSPSPDIQQGLDSEPTLKEQYLILVKGNPSLSNNGWTTRLTSKNILPQAKALATLSSKQRVELFLIDRATNQPLKKLRVMKTEDYAKELEKDPSLARSLPTEQLRVLEASLESFGFSMLEVKK